MIEILRLLLPYEPIFFIHRLSGMYWQTFQKAWLAARLDRCSCRTFLGLLIGRFPLRLSLLLLFLRRLLEWSFLHHPRFGHPVLALAPFLQRTHCRCLGLQLDHRPQHFSSSFSYHRWRNPCFRMWPWPFPKSWRSFASACSSASWGSCSSGLLAWRSEGLIERLSMRHFRRHLFDLWGG